MRSRLSNGARGLLAILMLIISGCASQGPAYRYRVAMPMMTVAMRFWWPKQPGAPRKPRSM